MKRTLSLLSAVSVMLAMTMAPALGANLTGLKLDLFTGSSNQELAANEPFHVSHGWTVSSGPFQGPVADSTMPISTFEFDLLVDGESAKNTGRWRLPHEEATDLSIHWVYNFEDGMTGFHTFTGLWYASCEWALINDPGFEPIPNSCLSATSLTERRAPVLVLTRTVEVTFVP